MVAYSFDENIVSDLYKDVFGYRPRENWWIEWRDMTNDEKQEEWDYLIKRLEEVMEEENKARDAAILKWHRRIAVMAAEFNISFADAVRWDMDAMDMTNDHDFYEYENGLPIGHVVATLAGAE